MGKKEFLEDGDHEYTGMIPWDKLNENGEPYAMIWEMKEFERQICSPSAQKKLWEDA